MILKFVESKMTEVS